MIALDVSAIHVFLTKAQQGVGALISGIMAQTPPGPPGFTPGVS
jgi:hypothetical protein